MAESSGQLMSEIRVPFGMKRVVGHCGLVLIWRGDRHRVFAKFSQRLRQRDFGVSGIRMSAKPFAISITSAQATVKTLFNIVPETAVVSARTGDVCSIAKSTVFNNPDACASRG